MCRSIDKQLFSPKTSLIQDIGGDSQLNFIILNFCEFIRDDADLKVVSEQIPAERLTHVMKTLLFSAFQKKVFDSTARNSVIIKNYALFELGINPGSFLKLTEHFETALRTGWLEEALVQECLLRFSALQSIFEEQGIKELERAAQAHRDLALRLVNVQLG